MVKCSENETDIMGKFFKVKARSQMIAAFANERGWLSFDVAL